MNHGGGRLRGAAGERVAARGKFLALDGETFWVRGVTYGTFRPDRRGDQFPSQERLESDLAMMAAAGANTLRLYTPPPARLLDAAARHDLRVISGLSWADHVAFLDDRRSRMAIRAAVRAAVRGAAGHPAVLCYAIGNEIPGGIVRWHGAGRVERFLRELYDIVKEEDSGSLATYVNFPTTEYLDLGFLDVVAFNVFLERRDRLERYLARLQNIAGDRPLVLTELGLDSRRNGERVQAETLHWQLRAAYAGGCAGAVVFAWTDEWYRGGHDIEDWDFGLVTRDRRAKPALAAVSDVFRSVPFGEVARWPRMSVVVCSYNGAGTVRETLEHLSALDYPDYEVIVVDDGSSDATVSIAREFDVRLISTPNRGLASARNEGLRAATGEVVAYIDDDAYPHPCWLRHLAWTFLNTEHVGVGGPNVPPPGQGFRADCVSHAPGGPTHVLLTDEVAEHIPGCNMAFRREALLAVGGFDPRFRATGDDVDICWRLQERGWTIGFSAGAMNWHHRRGSIRRYLRQQVGYGLGEALLEGKWPQRYCRFGHVAWSGRIYSPGRARGVLGDRPLIYHGVWGAAPFQSLYERPPGTWSSLSLMPEWYLVLALLAGLGALAPLWPPMAVFLALSAGGLAVSIGQAVRSAAAATDRGRKQGLGAAARFATIAVLHLLQPAARLTGRMKGGLTPWRWHGERCAAIPVPRRFAFWCERWEDQSSRLRRLQAELERLGVILRTGGDFDAWDLEVRAGPLGAVRGTMAVEEHGAGRQLVRVRIWPRMGRPALAITVLAASTCALALAVGQVAVGGVMIALLSLLVGWTAHDFALATGVWMRAVSAFARTDGTMEVDAGAAGLVRPVLQFLPRGARGAAEET